MKRRFILSGIGLAILSLRSHLSHFGASQEKKNQLSNSIHKNDKSNMDQKSNMSNMESLVILSPKQEFILPKDPVDGHFIVFRANDEVTQGAAIIRRNGSLIMGQKEDLEIDLKAQFTLVYSDKHKSWGIG